MKTYKPEWLFPGFHSIFQVYSRSSSWLVLLLLSSPLRSPPTTRSIAYFIQFVMWFLTLAFVSLSLRVTAASDIRRKCLSIQIPKRHLSVQSQEQKTLNRCNIWSKWKQIQRNEIAFSVSISNFKNSRIFGIQLGYGSSRTLSEAAFIFTNCLNNSKYILVWHGLVRL